MEVVLITGCSRGIGFGLAEVYAKQNVHLLATCRNPQAGDPLNTMLRLNGKIPALALDTTSKESVKSLLQKVSQLYGKIDILINNAGISTSNHPHDPPDQLDTEEMMKVFTTNVAGNCLMTQTMLPLLKASPNPRCVCISSFLGSISRNQPSESNFYMATSYRCSKSALNQLMKCFSLSVPDVTFLSLSPGHVQTELGNSEGRTAPLTVDEVSEGIADLCSTLARTQSGSFLDYKGETIEY